MHKTCNLYVVILSICPSNEFCHHVKYQATLNYRKKLSRYEIALYLQIVKLFISYDYCLERKNKIVVRVDARASWEIYRESG